MAIDKQDYLNLITSQYQTSTKMMEWLSSLFGVVQDITTTLESIDSAYDVDTAVGAQLDVCGDIVGISRELEVPLSGIFFSWGDSTLGWGLGVWQDEADPQTELVSLPDDVYRTIIKAKIVANSWQGSIPGIYDSWSIVFSDEGTMLLIQNRYDMKYSIAIAGAPLSEILRQLLIQGLLPLRPAGVEIFEYFAPASSDPLFAWGIENSILAGWGTGAFAEEVYNV